jgi:bacterioferritin-associated ferredoxin
MIICQCKVVTTRCVAQALDAGASTTAQVCRHTKAGGDCGSCVLTIKSLVRQHTSIARPGPDAMPPVVRRGRFVRQ